MPKWTDEQKEAIYKEGTNIIVSAGAGSGKTAVLTERVLEKVKKGISVDNLLILTFTKMAAKEMRERIGEKLKENGFTKELSKLDTADITTFDAYALSLVKKYHYYLNLSKDINIIDASVIGLYKEKMLKDIFEELYTSEDSKFLNLIKEYALKDDKEIFSFILNINNKLDLKTNKREYLDSYISIKYNEENIDKDIDNYIKVILNLINNIIDNSKIENNSYVLTKKDEDIVYLVEETVLDMKDYIEEKGIELIFDTDVEEKIVRCGKTEIERCIINLVGNAVKFTPKGGLIEVTIKDLDDKVQISVKDNGIGISEENKKLIFDRFNQVVDENAEVKGGSGLGLTISKQLITLHGGHIYVESEVGVGSEFIIILPVNND